jgi:hypothetical protein
VWSVTVEIETDDPELKRQILNDVDAWRERCHTTSVRTREELPGDGKVRHVFHTSRSTCRLEIVPENADDQDHT